MESDVSPQRTCIMGAAPCWVRRNSASETGITCLIVTWSSTNSSGSGARRRNLLFRFKARVIDRGADSKTKLLNFRSQRRLSLLSLPPLSERIYIRFKAPVFL